MADWQAVQGISSFAFQGTNAQAVLCLRCPAGELLHRGMQQAQWNKQRHWYSGPAHQLLGMVAVHTTHSQAVFQTTIAQACLGKQGTICWQCLLAFPENNGSASILKTYVACLKDVSIDVFPKT